MGVWLLNITPVPMRQNQGFLLFLITQSGVKTYLRMHRVSIDNKCNHACTVKILYGFYSTLSIQKN